MAAGELTPAAARSLISRMTLRQNHWTLGSFCASYCRIVTIHHAVEDTHMFPDLAAAQPSLQPVLDRLEAEHLVIAGVLDRFDRALVDLVREDEMTAVPDPRRDRRDRRTGNRTRRHPAVAPGLRGGSNWSRVWR